MIALDIVAPCTQTTHVQQSHMGSHRGYIEVGLWVESIKVVIERHMLCSELKNFWSFLCLPYVLVSSCFHRAFS